MAQRIRVLMPEGFREFYIYDDNRALAADYIGGILAAGEEVIYRSLVCEIMNDFVDCDGDTYLALLMKGGLGNVIDFNVL